jgi:hypothetical protein
MKKQAYQQPQLHTVNIHMENLLQTVSQTSNNVGINATIQGGSGPARGRESSGWFDDDDE